MAEVPPSQSSASPPPPRRRWAWWKRVLMALGVLLLLLAIFHRPIIFGVAKYAIKRIGAKEHLDIDLQLGGTIFTSLRVENLKVRPTAPGIIPKADVGRLEVGYSLPTLIRGGLDSPFLGDVVLHNADIVYDPSKSPPSPPKKKEPFTLPVLPLPRSLSLRNVTFQMLPSPEPVAKAKAQNAAASSVVPAPAAPAVASATEATADAGLLVKNANLELNPQHTGELKIDEVRIPGGLDLHDVSATTAYHDRNLKLTNLVLAPELRFRSLGLDASKLDTQQKVSVALDADLFGGTANADILLEGTKAPPKASVRLDVAGIALAGVRDFLKLDLPLDGTLSTAAIRFDGTTDKPNSWVGRVEAKIDKPAFGKTALDAVNVRLNLRDGVAELESADVVAGDNRVALRAKVNLPAQMADLVRATGQGNLKIAVPDLGKLPVELPVALGGSLNAGGDFALADGTFKLNGFKGHLQGFNAPAQRASVAALDFALDATETLPPNATAPPPVPNAPPPPPKPFWQGLKTRLALTSEGIVYGDYKLDGAGLTVSTDEAAVKLEQVAVTRADNRLDVDGTYQLPADLANWQKNPLAVRLSLAAPDVSQFSTDLAADPLQGRLNAKGNVTLEGGNYAGGFDLEARDLRAKGAKVETADVQIGIVNNQATVRTGHIRFDDKNSIDLSGQAGLQAPYRYEAGVEVDLTDLSRFEPVLQANNVEGKVGGALRIAGKAAGHAATAPDATDRELNASLDVTARALEAKGAKIDSINTQVVVENNTAIIKTGEVRLNPKSALTFGGQAGINAPYPFKGNVRLDLPDLASFQPVLAANNVNQKISGALLLNAQASGHAATGPDANDQAIDGTVDLTGRNIEAGGAKIEQLDGHIVADNNQAVIKTFLVKFNDKNTIDVGGQAGTRAPFDYQAKLNVNLQDLKVFEPILQAAQAKAPSAPATTKAGALVEGPKPQVLVDANAAKRGYTRAALAPASQAATVQVPTSGSPAVRREARRKAAQQSLASKNAPKPEQKLAGAVQLQWEGKGNFAKDEAGPQYAGAGKLAIRHVEFNAIGPVEGDVAGQYAQQVIDFPTFFVSSNGLEFRTTIALKDALARVDKISLKQGPTELLAGYIQIPLDLQKLSAPGGPIPDVDKIDVNIASKPLSLETLFKSIDKTKPAPALGTVELGINAHGSLSKIVALVKVQARGLRSPQFPTIRPADANVNLALHDNHLDLDTSLRQPQIQPLTIKGGVPLDLNAIVASKELDPNLPVNLTVSLPRSNLGFLSGVTKSLRFIEGNVAADVRVAGTVGKPTFAGSLELNIPAARAENITVPAIRDFQARLAFAQMQLRVERFNGDIGGGKLNVAGQMDFKELTDPILNFTATAKDVLAVRDDNVTARVNADIRISGPLAGATVAGSVGITKSRYLKDIDIVPISLPGKPAPAPPSEAESDPSIGINVAPINHWKFDLAIKTDDPFYVRGNLANGTATVDLHLRGTGATPLLDGNVTVENLVASLPFSRLEISNGNVQFTPDQPLNPVLDLTGTSTVSTYLVTVYISGRAKDPKVQFSSEPPLPQEQIVALLATGSTTDQLAGNSEALAGKATLLVLEDLYRRTFKKKNTSANAEPRSTLADRLNVDVGSVDPATGKQEVTTRFKITDTVQFLADFGIEGDLRGRVKYLIRFR